jgi:hypothetical protein
MPTLSIFPFTQDQVTRGLQAGLWDNVPFEAAKSNPQYGTFEYSDFDNFFDTEATVTALNSGASESFDKVAATKGKRRLTATTAADHRGVQVLLPAIGSFQPAAGRTIVLDLGLDLRLCSTFFIGLIEDGATIFDASSVLPTNKDYIGFYRLDGGVVKFVSHKEGSPDVDDEVDLLAATYYHAESTAQDEITRIGLRISGLDKVRASIDNVGFRALMDTISGTSIPDGVLTPAFAIARGETQDEATVVLDADYYGVYSS